MQQRGVLGLAKKKLNFKLFIDPVKTNQALGWAPAGSALQVTPTSPEILPAETPEGRRGATSAALGDWALLPIIRVVRFHHSTITTLGKWNLQHWRCPALHLLALIVGRGFPETGGAMSVSARGRAPAAARVAKARAKTTLNCMLFGFFWLWYWTLSTEDCLSEECR